MDKIVARVRALKCSNGSYCFIPATPSDRRMLDTFCGEVGNQIVSATCEVKRANKTWEQVKTVWALIEIICEAVNGHKPVGNEAELMYDYLIQSHAECYCYNNPFNPEEVITQKVTLSKMSKQQAASFINTLINVLANDCNLDNSQQMSVKEIFEQYMSFRSGLKDDFLDRNESGEYLSIEEFRQMNTVSFASGIGGSLDLAHIVSKGTAPQFRDCCWNCCLLTHEEHMLQHQKGWDEFLKIYPHLKGRVDRARKLAGKLARIMAEEEKDEFDIF